MKLFEFNKYFPDEAACRRAFREMRDKEGVLYQPAPQKKLSG